MHRRRLGPVRKGPQFNLTSPNMKYRKPELTEFPSAMKSAFATLGR